MIGDFLYINDVKQLAYKLVKYEGDYYFINDGHRIARSQRLYLSAKFVEGHTYDDGTALQPGYFEFDADGKMIIEKEDTPGTPDPDARNGVIGDFLYINDVKQLAYKLVKYEGDYYFINDGHRIARSQRLYLGTQFVTGHTYDDGTALQPGYYEFDAEGKMILK